MEENTNNEPGTPGMPEPAPAGKSFSFGSTISWMRDLVLSILIAIVLIVFIYQPVKVEGTSMMPALSDQERIFINKFTYQFGLSSIERGDTVVFWRDRERSFIKRVIGLPGDRVRIDHGTVIVNGKPLVESYVPECYRDPSSMEEITVLPNQYFVLGDHRSSSSDSRAWGCVKRDAIYGKAVFVYWPLDKLGRLR